jgi:hypothetical protein
MRPSSCASCAEIKASFWKLHPHYESMDKLNFINPGLSELVDEYAIVQSRGKKRSADRTYRFTNPLMRAYVLVKMRQEGQMQLDVGDGV